MNKHMSMVTNPFDPGYYTEDDLSSVGFRSIGENVRIAKDVTIVGVENISIGSHVRIDGGCTILASGPGGVQVGSFIHLGAGCYLGGGSGIELSDFCGLSQGVKIYSRTDDYTGRFMTNPTVPEEYTGVSGGRVVFGRHVIVGAGSVVLPKVTIGEGSSVGALSLVSKNLEAWGIYFGIPVRRLKRRSDRLLELEEQLRRQLGTG